MVIAIAHNHVSASLEKLERYKKKHLKKPKKQWKSVDILIQ
jgi:hypothetical protein